MKRGKVTLAVYDLAGRKLATVVNEDLPPGRYNITWDCTSAGGAKLGPGIYVYVLKKAEVAKSGKLVITD